MKAIAHTERVEVYYHRRRKCLSVLNKEGKVIAHAQSVLLAEVTFKISEKGRLLTIGLRPGASTNGKRRPHAFACGRLIDTDLEETELKEVEQILPNRVTYNPFQSPTFIYAKTNDPIYEAEMVLIVGNKIFVGSDRCHSPLMPGCINAQSCL